MGLGKTVQVIARLLDERTQTNDPGPTLLIAPTSVLTNWRKEIQRFAPCLRTLVHQGSQRIRDEQAFRLACQTHDVVVTSFALARLDEKLLRSIQWRRVVVDEAQNIKNPESAQARAISKLAAQHRLALTGTPVQNRLLDLWSIFNFLHPGYLGKQAQFRRTFETPIQKDYDLARSATLKRLVEPCEVQRLGAREPNARRACQHVHRVRMSHGRRRQQLAVDRAGIAEHLVQSVERLEA